MGRRCAELLPTRNADHVGGIWALAGRTDLERAVRGWRCGRCAPSAGRDHVAERRILGTRWGLFSVRIATHRPPVDHCRQPCPLESPAHYARPMVTAANRRCTEGAVPGPASPPRGIEKENVAPGASLFGSAQRRP